MPSIAPLVAAIQRRLANLPGPLSGSGEASNGEPVQIELLVAGVWVDITSYELVWDDNGKISVTSGIRDEGSQTQAAQSALQLKNPDGRFSPLNPVGDYYDILTWRNAQIRISVPDGLGGKSYLIWGEASEWDPDWDSTGTSVWADVAVNGIMQRLAQGPAPERSIIYRATTDPLLNGTVAYWPCEDPSGSIELKSALVNGSSMTWTGNPELAAYDGFGASDPLPILTGASLSGGVARYDASVVTQYQMRFLLYVPPAGFSDLDTIARLQVAEVPAGVSLLDYFDIWYNNPAGGLGSFGGTGTLTIQAKDGDQATVGPNASTTMDVRGHLLRVSLENSISGATLTSTLRVLDINSGVTDSASVSIGSTSLSRVVAMSLAPATLDSTAGLTGGAAGHLLLQNTITSITDLGRAIQPAGEAAGQRIQRLCGEEAVAFEWIGDLDDTVPLGPQGKQNLLALVQEAALADGGFLYETTSQLGLGYRTLASLYNQDPALTLSYTGFNLADIPVPATDDRYIQNRVVVTVGGASQTYTETTGKLGTDTIGVYGEPSGITLNLASSDEATLRDQAAWRVRIGTVEDARYPKVSVNLAHSSITPEMRRAILALRIGDRMQMTGMPSWLAPDTVDQLIVGKDQSLNHFEHRLTFTCMPAAPYSSVGYIDGPDSRIDIDGSELLTAVGSSETSLTVVPSAGQTMLWTTDSSDWPFDVRVSGETMRVTGVTNWLTDTFTRSVSNSWGTPDVGSAWSTVGGGVASDYAVNGSAGVHTLSTVDETRRTAVTAAGPDFDLYCDITTSALATGDSLYGAVTARMLDSGNMYMARLEFTTANTIVLVLRRLLADVGTDLGTYTLPGVTHVAGTYIRVRFQGVGSRLRAKVYPASDPVEDPAWHVSGVDSGISAAYSIGTRSIRVTGNTNAASVAIQYDNYRVINPQTLTVTRSINGVTKSQAAGADIRLANPTYIAL